MANPTEVLALAEHAIELGYERDSVGRLLGTRDPDPRDRREPAFHLVRTPHGNRWAVSAHLPTALARELEAALASEPTVGSLVDLEVTSPVIAFGGELYRGPAFRFPPQIAEPAIDVEVVESLQGLRTVAELEWVRDVSLAARPVCVARNDAGTVVAVCHSSRSLPSAAAAGVETAESYRGAGLGTAVVAGWARAVRAQGREPQYGTEWSNVASRGVAQRLVLVMWGEEAHPA